MMFRPIAYSMEDVHRVLARSEINAVGVETIAESQEAELFREENIRWIREQGLYVWVNTINLSGKKECFLCGVSERNTMEFYQKSGSIGIISLNDWYVLDFRLGHGGEKENITSGDSNSITTFGNNGGISYILQGSPGDGTASVEISLPENYRLDVYTIQSNLCQKCLDNVTASLRYGKWRYEKKEAIPLCLVDFKTLEIYSLQDWNKGCMIRDYWVAIQLAENKGEIEVSFGLLFDGI